VIVMQNIEEVNATMAMEGVPLTDDEKSPSSE
jgi:hypothetical protein